MAASGELSHAVIERIVIDALETLYAENEDILRLDVAERAICAQLAAILQRRFDHHAVHVEYNRHGVDPKEIALPDAQGAPTTHRVNPDIIVHHPGNDDENVLVIEAKKTTNPLPDDADLDKLKRIKQQIHYHFAVFLRLPTGPGADLRDVKIEWV